MAGIVDAIAGLGSPVPAQKPRPLSPLTRHLSCRWFADWQLEDVGRVSQVETMVWEAWALSEGWRGELQAEGKWRGHMDWGAGACGKERGFVYSCSRRLCTAVGGTLG